MKLFFATDIHGSDICWNKFLNAGKFYEANVIVMGGNIQGKLLIPIIKEAIVTVGAKGPQDMGKVMGTVNKKIAGKAEGRVVAELVKKLLNQ